MAMELPTDATLATSSAIKRYATGDPTLEIQRPV
jgi:hypothetical protein